MLTEEVMAGDWITASATIAVAIVTPFLTAFVPRMWQNEQRRLQAEAETRVKILEALEKGITVAAKAKSELEIDIDTHDLRNELEQIVHEFAGPVVLSRESPGKLGA